MSWRNNAWSLAACVVACLGVLACQPAETSNAGGGEYAGVVVAWVDGEAIGVEDVLAARFRRGEGTREEWVEAAVLNKVASLEARRRKLHEQPKVAKALRDVRLRARQQEQQILRSALKEEIVKDSGISEEELRKAYQEQKGLTVDLQLRLRQWEFGSEQEARDALEGAKGAAALDPSEATELEPFSLRDPPMSYRPVSRELRRPGDRAVVEVGGEWLVLEVVEYVTDAKRPFEDVRDRLRKRMRLSRSERMLEERLQELRAGADVRIDQAVLSNEELWRKPK